MKKEFKYWRLVAIMLLLIVIFLSLQIFQNYRSGTYKFGDFGIKKSQFDTIVEELGDDYRIIRICNIEEDICITVGSTE